MLESSTMAGKLVQSALVRNTLLLGSLPESSLAEKRLTPTPIFREAGIR
jgi:hypothetical protein